MRWFVVFLALLAAPGARTAEPGEPVPPRLELVFETSLRRDVTVRSLLYLPQAYGDSSREWPLVLYLHGGMGRGDDFRKVLWYPVPRMLEEGSDNIPFIVVVPQCPEGEMWTDTEALVALLDEVCSSYAVDRSRLYLVGYSMGGHGAWYLAYKHPERFAAVAPMSGMANPWWSTRLKDVPIWVFHGAKDDIVPARESQEMVDALRAKGGDVCFSLDPERGHSPPTQEEHRMLFEWLLTHRKENR